MWKYNIGRCCRECYYYDGEDSEDFYCIYHQTILLIETIYNLCESYSESYTNVEDEQT